MDVAGKVVLVTGGGGGIGEGIAEAFVEKGARVAVTDIDPARAAEVAARLGHGAIGLAQDVSSRENWAHVRSQVEAALGPVDVLVNNAGVALPFMPMEDVKPETFDKVMAVNVAGVFHACQAFIPQMKARGSGHIVNVSSVNGQIPFGSFSVYCASKFAVAGLSEALQQELAPSGVGVSILYPGLTRSRMSEAQASDFPEERRQAFLDGMMDPVWLGRAVVRAVENNELHIITHPEHKGGVEARIDALFAAYGEPAQPGYMPMRF